jgi:hypothetical protein
LNTDVESDANTVLGSEQGRPPAADMSLIDYRSRRRITTSV